MLLSTLSLLLTTLLTLTCVFFFFNDTATTEIYTLSLHDALPISEPSSVATRARCRGPVPSLDQEAPSRRARCPRRSVAAGLLQRRAEHCGRCEASRPSRVPPSSGPRAGFSARSRRCSRSCGGA